MHVFRSSFQFTATVLCSLSQLMQLINGVVLPEADRLALSNAGVAV